MSKPLIISADTIKHYFPKYNPKKSTLVHIDSAKIADKWLKSSIKHIDTKVILLGGGSASGKTEYLSSYLGI